MSVEWHHYAPAYWLPSLFALLVCLISRISKSFMGGFKASLIIMKDISNNIQLFECFSVFFLYSLELCPILVENSWWMISWRFWNSIGSTCEDSILCLTKSAALWGSNLKNSLAWRSYSPAKGQFYKWSKSLCQLCSRNKGNYMS